MGAKKQQGKQDEPKDEILELSGGLGEPKTKGEEEDSHGVRQEEREGEEALEPTAKAETEEEGEEAETPEKDEAKETEEAERLKAEEEAAEREKALREEVTQLRGKLRELRDHQTRFQAPAPIDPVPPIEGVPAQVGGIPIELEITDDGRTVIKPESLQRIVEQQVRQQVESATRPHPQEVLRNMIEEEKRQWVGFGEGAEERFAISNKMQQAADYLQLVSEHHEKATGYRFGAGSTGQAIQQLREAGILDQFAHYFPEVQNAEEFIDIFFSPMHNEDRIRHIRKYMDRNYGTKKTPEVIPEREFPSPQPGESEGKVTPLAPRPRSMSKRGTHAPADTSEKARLSALQVRATNNPMSLTPKEWEDLDKGLKKYGAA